MKRQLSCQRATGWRLQPRRRAGVACLYELKNRSEFMGYEMPSCALCTKTSSY
jgi:hypothetical protein